MDEKTAKRLIAALEENTAAQRRMAAALDSAADSLNDLAIIIESAVDEGDIESDSPLLGVDFFSSD